MNSHQPNVERAEALLKKKQERLREGQLAMAEYQADGRAVREKTARLRALRLARDAAHYRPGEEALRNRRSSRRRQRNVRRNAWHRLRRNGELTAPR